MASDGDAKASPTKRVTASTSVKGKALESPKKSKSKTNADVDNSAAGSNPKAATTGGADAFTEGMTVSVRSTDGDMKTMLAATVVRVHRSGELSVKYDGSGAVEKNVRTSRVQRRSLKEDDSNDDEDARSRSLEEGDIVLYRLNTDADCDDAAWREGTVKTCRRDGAYDIIDAASDDVVRKVAKNAVKRAPQSSSQSAKDKAKSKAKDRDAAVAKRRNKRDDDDESASDDSRSDEKTLLAADAAVEFRDKRRGWCPAHIHRVHSDGTFDLAVATDDGEDDEIVKRVERRRIRKPKTTKQSKTKTATSSSNKRKSKDNHSDDDNDSDAASAVRKRRHTTPKRGGRVSSDSDNDSDDHSAASRRDRNRKPPPVRASGSRALVAPPLRVNQIVQFQDATSGRLRRGRIKLLRKDDATCDIAHASDADVVSKRVAMADVRAVSTFAQFMGDRRPTWLAPRDPRVFALNARVLYRTPDNSERKAVVVKVYGKNSSNSTSTGPLYDIEDILDGTLLKKVAGSTLRAVPWLPDINLPSVSFPTLSLFTTRPHKGMRVRFRYYDTTSKSKSKSKSKSTGVWTDGVVERVKSDNTCVVAFTTASGAREHVRVPMSDIQLPPPFGISNPLRDLLPAIELPRQLHAVGSCVDVVSGSDVFLATVVATNDADRTYTVTYADGRTEKNVPADRVRLSLRRLRIGTEVEMIVEGPCREVSRLDGEVAWVHRDERVAVRLHGGGHNDVFAQVCSHALMVDGEPAFAAPLSSTWLELLGFYLNVALETLVYTWLCIGLVVQMGAMVDLVRATSSDRLQDAAVMAALFAAQHVDWAACPLAPSRLIANSTSNTTAETTASSYVLIPTEALETERAWLVALLVLTAALTVGCVACGARLVRSKILAIQDNYIDVREYQREQVLMRHLGRVMGAAIVVSAFTLVVFAALLGRFAAFCLLPGSAAAVRFDTLALASDAFAVRVTTSSAPSVSQLAATTTNVVALLLAASGQTSLNVVRALALHALVFAFPVRATAFMPRLLLVLPAVALTALLAALGIAALHVFYYVSSTADTATATADADRNWAVVLVLATLWLVASIFSIVAAAGRFHAARTERSAVTPDAIPDDVLQQAERGEFGLQAKREVLLTKVEQLQSHLGVCKLSVVRVHSRAWLHVVVMVFAIYANGRLRSRVATHASAAVRDAVTFHLVSCVLWLVASVFATLAAYAIKQDARVRELWNYLLDV